MFGFDTDTLHRIRACFAQFPQIHRVLLYGSRAMGTQHPGSDVDITLIGKNLSRKNILLPLSDALDELLLPVTFDCSIFIQLENPELIRHILERGVCFYEANIKLEEGWEVFCFEDCIDKVKATTKIPKKKFLEEGEYPVVSQEEEFISGYWNNPSDVFKVDKPVVIFGDHTKKVKYIDFNFVLGADGVKVFLPNKRFNSKFFAYQLQSKELRDLGYARYYRLLKATTLVAPPLPEQEAIIATLDQAFAAIDQAKAKLERNIANAKELFQSKLNAIFSQKGEGWVETTLSNICIAIFAGGDAPKDNFSKTPTEKYSIPVFANGEKNKGIYGFTDTARVFEPSITVSARGTIGYSAIRNEPFLPIVRLIVLTPDLTVVSLEFLHYIVKSINFLNTGSSIPQLTVPMIKKYHASIPALEKQAEIVSRLKKSSEALDKVTEYYQRKLSILEELKKSILQKAFSGQLAKPEEFSA